ncbi:MAG: PKD domain-containing protein [Vicinamibacterales bacterium]
MSTGAQASQGGTATRTGTGSLLVTSDPPDASVTVDRRVQSRAAITISNLAPGTHRVTVTRPGYLENSRMVTVVANRRTEVRVSLTPGGGTATPTTSPSQSPIFSTTATPARSKAKWLIPLVLGGAGAGVAVALTRDGDGGPPSATTSFSPAGAGLAGATVFTFSAGITSGKAPFTYSWDFGDGQSASGQTTAHMYSSPGTFTAVLTATDAVGRRTTSQLFVQVGVLTGSWTMSLSPPPSNGGVLTFIQNQNALSVALNDTVSTGPRTGTGAGSTSHPKSFTASVTYAVSVSVSSPFTVQFTASGDSTLNTFTGTATGYALCPCIVVLTRQ